MDTPITVTYQDLLNNETKEDYLKALEQLTGARNVYGLNNPILLTDIYITCGFDLATFCFNCLSIDSSSLAQSIALSWWEDNYSIGITAGGNMAEPLALVAYALQYQQTQNEHDPGRIDYCGNPLLTPASVTINQVEQAIINLTNVADAMELLTLSDGYWRSISDTFDGGHINHPKIGPVFDYPGSSFNPTISQSQELVEDLLFRPTPHDENTFLEDSVTYEQQARSSEYSNTTGKLYWWLVSFLEPVSMGNGYVQCIQSVYYAAISLAQMLIYDLSDPMAVRNYLTAAYGFYTGYVPGILGRDISTYQMYETSNTPPITYLANLRDSSITISSIDFNIRQAEESVRATLETDVDYVRSFDLDLNDRLSNSERLSMEQDIKNQMIQGRRQYAQAKVDDLQLQIQEIIALIPILESSFLLHISTGV